MSEVSRYEDCPMGGAVTRGGTPQCMCGKCLRCGWPKHSAIHSGTDKNPDKPFGHYFVAPPSPSHKESNDDEA